MPVRVRLLGRPRVEGDGQPYRQPRDLKSWGLLGKIALTHSPVGRHQLAAELFPDANDPLGALRWSLADLRDSLGLPAALRGDQLVLTADQLWLDVWALEDGCLPTADIGGELLDGVNLHRCPGFETWLLLARSRCAVRSREELHRQALELMANRDMDSAVTVAGRAAGLDPLDETAQELFLRALVAAGREAQASVHLATCAATFDREGLMLSPALRAAVRSDRSRPRTGVRAAVVARSLLQAGTARWTLVLRMQGWRRCAVPRKRPDRHEMLCCRRMCSPSSAVLWSMPFEDSTAKAPSSSCARCSLLRRRSGSISAPRFSASWLSSMSRLDATHPPSGRALRDAMKRAASVGDEGLTARILAVQGMNEADRGRHGTAAALLSRSADSAGSLGQQRQRAWSLGLLARSLLLAGQPVAALEAADTSVCLAQQERWNAFLPWPQVMRAQARMAAGDWASASGDVEEAFALACELGDPCWEGIAGRGLAVIAAHDGDYRAFRTWIAEARRRCDRVPDRYVWVSAYIGLTDLEFSRGEQAVAAAARLHHDAVRSDLPEFLAWALVHQAELGDRTRIALAQSTADGMTSPMLHERTRALAHTGDARTATSAS